MIDYDALVARISQLDRTDREEINIWWLEQGLDPLGLVRLAEEMAEAALPDGKRPRTERARSVFAGLFAGAFELGWRMGGESDG